MCRRHRRRWLAHGDPENIRPTNGTPYRLFEAHVMDATDGCRLWPFGVGGHGYGQVTVPGEGQQTVHRLTCERWNGPAPTDMEAAHSCGVRRCWAGEHLRWATRVGNLRDCIEHGTAGKKLTVDEVISIKREIAARTGSYSQIGSRYGVTKSMICQIANGRCWGSVS